MRFCLVRVIFNVMDEKTSKLNILLIFFSFLCKGLFCRIHYSLERSES